MSPRGFTARLFLGQVLVGLLAVSSLAVVATTIGPGQFRQHLRQAGVALPAPVTHHAEQAFREATTLSLGVSIVAATVAALVLSVYLTRRMGRAVATLAHAASSLAAGHDSARISDAHLGAEFDELATAFNDMADRLQATEQTRRKMLGDLAHELRTPLSVLDAYLEGIEDGVRQADPATLGLLRVQTHRLTRLAEDVAAVSRAEERQEQLDVQLTPVADLVDSAVEVARSRYDGKGVALSVEASGAPQVRVDRQRLGQVLGNLLDNAWRHTPAGGSVVVRYGGEGRIVRVEVADTGEGIAAEHLDHVFERFYRVDEARDREHGGSGIGLAICKALVEAHGGRIRADSAGPGTGATFTVVLPAP
jgi:signal transduction histidine kinase